MVVDPAVPNQVINAAKSLGVNIKCLLTTHKHWDHAGGNEEMAKTLPGLMVVGSATDQIPAMTKPVKEGDTFAFHSAEVRVIEAPCHTRGHVLYQVTDPSNKEACLFSGDTLFVGGCGRFFEGGAEEMCENVEKMKKLPPSTRIFCGHEYTKKNLKFAMSVEPTNEDLKAKNDWVVEQNKQKLPTIPSTIEEELKYNPFMRYDLPELAASVGKSSPKETMAELRRRKDAF
eukprot:Platyproteum_vivax@DN6990_c0_g1_i2.p1